MWITVIFTDKDGKIHKAGVEIPGHFASFIGLEADEGVLEVGDSWAKLFEDGKAVSEYWVEDILDEAERLHPEWQIPGKEGES